MKYPQFVTKYAQVNCACCETGTVTESDVCHVTGTVRGMSRMDSAGHVMKQAQPGVHHETGVSHKKGSIAICHETGSTGHAMKQALS